MPSMPASAAALPAASAASVSARPQQRPVSSSPNCRDLCFVCGEHAKLRCSRCKSVRYCSLEHQRMNWGEHKQHCRRPPNNAGSSSSSSTNSNTNTSVAAATSRRLEGTNTTASASASTSAFASASAPASRPPAIPQRPRTPASQQTTLTTTTTTTTTTYTTTTTISTTTTQQQQQQQQQGTTTSAPPRVPRRPPTPVSRPAAFREALGEARRHPPAPRRREHQAPAELRAPPSSLAKPAVATFGREVRQTEATSSSSTATLPTPPHHEQKKEATSSALRPGFLDAGKQSEDAEQTGRLAARLRHLTQSFRGEPDEPRSSSRDATFDKAVGSLVNELPPELLQMVFNNLSARDLARVQLVCRTWMDASRCDSVWRPHVNLLGDIASTRGHRRFGAGRVSLAGMFAARRNDERMWRSGRYEQTTVSSHSANVEMVQLVSLVSPYGRCIVSGGWDGQLIVQPVRSAEEIERDQAAAAAATLANPSASLSASSTAGRTIPAAQNCGDNDASSINQSQDSSSHDRSYHETSPTTENIQQQIQKQLHKLLQAYRGNASPHGGWISCMDVSPNGRFIVSGACDGTLCLWRVVVLVMGEGEHGTRFVVEQEADPVAAAAQSRMVMLSTASHILVLPESVVRLPTGVAISCCKFVHDTCVVAGSSDSYARVFCRIDHGAAQRLQPGSTATEVRSEWILKRTLYGHRDCVWSTLPISQERLVTASRDGQAIIHDVRDCFHIESGDGETGEARPAARGERVMLFRDEPNQPLFQQSDERASNDPEPSYILEAHNEALLCMEVGYGASLLALGGADKTLCVWDLKPGVQTNGNSLAMSEAPMPMRVAKCKHRHGVLSVSFLTRWRNMATIAAGCANGDVAIWVLHERTSCEDSSASFATDRLRRKYSGISLVSVLTHNKGIPSIVCHRGVLVVVSPGDGVYVRMLDIDATSSLWKVREADMTSSACIADTTDAPEGLPEMLLAERADVGCFEASVAVTRKDATESRHSSRKDDKASASKHLHFNTCASPLHFNTCVSMLDGIHVGGSHCVALDDRYLVFGTNMGDVVRLDFSSS